MIPKKIRINRENFEIIMKKGRLLSLPLFSVRFLKNPIKSSHFSVVVSKKVAKTAILRNKIKRRIYSILNKNQPKDPYFIIFFAKKGIEKASFLQIKEGVLDALNKAKIL
jgi:ribonuclease P protein component